jgi:3-phosphoglycerate kinase
VSIAPKYNQHPFHHAQVQAILNIPVSQLKVGCYLGLDIGEESVKMFTNALEKSKTVLWNGPLGN